MGRPKKGEHEARSETLRFRVTVAEKAHVENQAATAGVSVADYARNIILGRRAKAAPVRDDSSLLYELNQVGVALAEIKRAGQGCDPDQVERVLSRLEAALDKVAADGP